MSPSVASPDEDRRDSEQIDACMNKIQDAFPSWLKRCSGARDGLVQQIRYAIDCYTASIETRDQDPRQTIKKALTATRDLRTLLEDLWEHDAVWAVGAGVSYSLLRGLTELPDESEENPDERRAFDDPALLSGVLLDGLEKSLTMTQAIVTPDRGRRRCDCEADLEIAILDELDRWRQRGLVEYSRAEQEALLDWVFSHLQIHLPNHALERPSEKTVQRHRKKYEKYENARGQRNARERQNLLV